MCVCVSQASQEANSPDQSDIIDQPTLGVVQACGFDAQFVAGDRQQVGEGAINCYDLVEMKKRRRKKRKRYTFIWEVFWQKNVFTE